MRHLLGLVAAAAGAAATMYYFDPDMGPQRRARLREKLVGGPQYAGTVLAQRGSRTGGRVTLPDGQLRDQVQTRLGALVSYPGAIHVQVDGGVVRLSGSVLRLEMDGLLTQVRDMPGVKRVVNAMAAQDSPEQLTGAQARSAQLTTEGQPS